MGRTLQVVLLAALLAMFGCINQGNVQNPFLANYPNITLVPANNSLFGNLSQNNSIAPPVANYKIYAVEEKFYTFTDPKEGAFSLAVPINWTVTNGSGIIRPYIDAGVSFGASSPDGQAFFYQDPFGYIYATPNALLTYAGFTEGSFYGSSGGYTQPMVVEHYMNASEFAGEMLKTLNVQTTNVSIIERPELAGAVVAPITQQSAAELSFDYGGTDMQAVFLIRTVLVEMSGTGVWYANVMGYTTPAELRNETELDVLEMERSFKVNPQWAAREQVEIRKRAGIISQSQSDIAATISSTFEVRSRSMDEINQKWDNHILGIEDVYNPDTGQHYIVDSGSKYYWVDNQGNIYGTDVNENPFPNEDVHPLDCPGC
ncbi:MAG: hypothetical protein PHS02_01345 [Candidatus ainarchaeum sp.]|nr:hypothetical protein [Candidatus ainarchaeum sp.]